MCLEAVRMSDATGSVGDTASHARDFLQNTLGAIFNATPHGGAPLADAVKKLDIFQKASPVLKLLADHVQLTDLTDDFDQYRRKWNWKTYGLGEVLPVALAGIETVVVPEVYGRRDKVDFYATVDTANRFSICKPDSKTHQSYVWIKRHVKDMLDKEFEAVIDRPYRAMHGLICSEKVDEALRYIQNIPDNSQNISKQLLEAGVMLSLMEVLKSDSSERKRGNMGFG
ncbi:hypothetical protein O6H91_21G003700 [Diphasiastrum complanatum]|uniref:Uncharacterized protein n=1 Tax=Diphasiastrum complanatum TaxID=34168 RepID=A0ACC2AHH7_DIPCM|nr:hypothetical protein O6H91_Y157900 [Diphasiastrum complanatum]KAJ7295873.1 hypothetical protein O6H91_Y157900 [Diphasiastrum complanatum]KAJ7516905.1 hypothetical protein O6H91_21G003700 [Diphasiastrum complanatum]